MALSIFDDKTHQPTTNDLIEKLRNTYQIWDKIKNYVFNLDNSLTDMWGFTGKKYGWGYRIKDKKRAVIYLIPCDGFFKVAFVFGKKATEQALNSSIPDNVKKEISETKVYAEGRGFRIDITKDEDFDFVKELIYIKMNN